VKHATKRALDELGDLLGALRRIDLLQERRRGVFYYRSRAFLHFHEDPAGPFADLRTGGTWQRQAVHSQTQRRALVRRVERFVVQRPTGSAQKIRRAERRQSL
jgi:hypothetical protein